MKKKKEKIRTQTNKEKKTRARANEQFLHLIIEKKTACINCDECISNKFLLNHKKGTNDGFALCCQIG